MQTMSMYDLLWSCTIIYEDIVELLNHTDYLKDVDRSVYLIFCPHGQLFVPTVKTFINIVISRASDKNVAWL